MSEHGNHHGRNGHVKRREPLCEECREFHREYMRSRRLARSSNRAFIFPPEIPNALRDLNGLGVSIARGLRESA